MTEFLDSWEVRGIVAAAIRLLLILGIVVVLSVLVAAAYAVLRWVDPRAAARKAGQKPDKWSWTMAWADALGTLPYVLVIGMVGGLTGHLGGSSRESVVGSLLPAVFTLFGGFVAYYVGVKRDRSGKLLVNTVAFLVAFFAAYNVAAVWRQSNENWDFCRTLYSSPDFETLDERQDRAQIWLPYCSDVFSVWMDLTAEKAATEPAVPPAQPAAPAAAQPSG